jgi:hypothetical protein
MTKKQDAIIELEQSDNFLLITIQKGTVRAIGTQSMSLPESLAFCQILSRWLETHVADMRKTIGSPHKIYDADIGRWVE